MYNRHLQARIAILNYYASLMQGYKTYILTLVVAILTLFEIGSRISFRQFSNVNMNRVTMSLSLTSGLFVSAILVFIIRFLWCGQIVTSAIRTPSRLVTLHNLDEVIKQYATDSKNWKDGKRSSSHSEKAEFRLWRLLMDIGDCKSQLVILWASLAVILGFVIFESLRLFLGT